MLYSCYHCQASDLFEQQCEEFMQYLSTSMPAFPSATAMYKALAKEAAEDARQQAELEASADMAEEQERLERLMKMKSASMSNIGRVLDEDKDAYETMR